MRLLTSFAPLLLIAACVAEDEIMAPEADEGVEELIYGADNRLEYYQASASLQTISNSVVAMMDDSFLTRRANGTWDVYTGYQFRDWVDLCTSEPYRTQPAPSDCSGVLVGPDLIATAGHCISTSSCGSAAFVFGFRYDGSGALRSNVAANDVYFCSQVVRRSTGTTDYALVRTDRAVTGHSPLSIRRSGKIATGTSVLLMGSPYGIPLKIAGGATVRSNSSTAYFGANLDSYSGNSGSPVINASTLQVEGILVRGNNDFDWTGSCYVSNVCSDSGCPGFEDATRTTRFSAYVP